MNETINAPKGVTAEQVRDWLAAGYNVTLSEPLEVPSGIILKGPDSKPATIHIKPAEPESRPAD